MSNQVTLHRVFQILTQHLQPLLLIIVMEMMVILRELVMWSHNTKHVTKQVTFSDQGQDNEIQRDSPDLSTTTTQADEW